jgi:hypothetical protein
MNKTVYVFSGLTPEVADRIGAQFGEADKVKGEAKIVLCGNLPEFGKKVTRNEITDISFAEFIQDLLKRDDKGRSNE